MEEIKQNHGFPVCLSNRKFERLVGPLDEIVTVSVKQIQRHNATSYDVMTSFDFRERLPRRWLFHLIYLFNKHFSEVKETSWELNLFSLFEESQCYLRGFFSSSFTPT